MRVDAFLDRRRRKGYDCLNFTTEVWLALTGEDLRGRLHELTGPGRRVGSAPRRFEKLACPQDPCLVVMHGRLGNPHIGVYLRGRVLHLLNYPEFTQLEVATRGFTRVSYYR
jgi:hypothetical protein